MKFFKELEKKLLQSQMKIRAEAYIAYALMSAIYALVISIPISIFLVIMEFKLGTSFLITLFTFLLPLIISISVFFGILSYPSLKAMERRKNIEANLPFAVNYISAMASADVHPLKIFKGLAKQKIYGEVQKETSWIVRDVEILGKDLITALRLAIERSPSPKFQEFLQGIITTSLSGGELKPYFVAKSIGFMRDNQLNQSKCLETLGILAETFVTVVVAAPLFLLVMISVFTLTESGASTTFLYLITFLMIPVSQAGFIFAIKQAVPGV